MVTLIEIKGNCISESVSDHFIQLIQNHPDFYSYIVHKLYRSITGLHVHSSHIQIALWTIGEYGHLLFKDCDSCDNFKAIDENDILLLIETISREKESDIDIISVLLNTLIKLSTRTSPSALAHIKTFINLYTSSPDIEIQQRACEYECILNLDENIRQSVLSLLPIPKMNLPQVVYNKYIIRKVLIKNHQMKKKKVMMDLQVMKIYLLKIVKIKKVKMKVKKKKIIKVLLMMI